MDVKEDVEKIIKRVLVAFPTIDLLINNASTFYPTPIEEISEDHWEKLIGSNLKGPMFLIKGLGKKLKESEGSIINITDTNLSKGVANFSIYSAAKAGLEAITKGLARELAPEIKVNAIAPGAFKTKMTKKIMQAGKNIAGISEFNEAKKLKNGSVKKIFKLTRFSFF